jgi:hypothetical protein
VELAARNKNLILPKYGEKFRLLSVLDAVEAIMRAVIISGTSSKTFEIAGNEIESKEVASVLIDLAKMTKTEIKEQTLPLTPSLDRAGEEEAYMVSAKALRWKPEIGFKEGVRELVEDMVARVDEEGRSRDKFPKNKPTISKNDPPSQGYSEASRFMMKAEVEEEKEEMKEEKKEIIVEDEEEMMEEEEVVGKKMEGKIVEPNLFKEKKIVKNELEFPISKPTISKQVPNDKSQITNKNKIDFPWKKVVVGFGLFGLFIVLMMGYFLWGVVGVAMGLQKPIKLLEEKRIDEAKKMIVGFQKQNKNVSFMWSNTKLDEISKISEEILNIEAKLCILAESMDKINGAIFEEKQIDFKNELLIISTNLLDIETKVGVVEARLTLIRKWIPGRWKPQIDSALDMISSNVELVSKLRQMVGVIPEMLGLDGKRREYLVLLQNEMELRATGGFIGSYGILSFQEGRLVSFDIKDVYEADGQLKGHVEPPEEIKRYLGEAAWFMRDSNWKASFPESATDVQWFFEKETGRKVDGVIGVNLAVVKAMLKATGEIYVTDFKEKVNKDNLYEQAEFYSESKFFPGSIQKASFLSGIGKQLFAEISNLKTLARWNLMMGLADVLEKNDLQIVLNEPNAAQIIGDLGWNGEVFVGACGLSNCYSDYLYIVESNLGVNKANYFLIRSVEQKIDIKENLLERILRINYENLAKTTNWPGGDYKNYLRIYLPKDIQVSEVTITAAGVVQNVALDQVKMVNMYDKRELGFLVNVPISKKVVVEVKYNSKFTQMSDKFSYLLYIQRQPGFGDTGIVNLVSIPAGYQPMQVSPSASVVSGKLLFNQKLDKDIKLGVELSK